MPKCPTRFLSSDDRFEESATSTAFVSTASVPDVVVYKEVTHWWALCCVLVICARDWKQVCDIIRDTEPGREDTLLNKNKNTTKNSS